MYKCSNFEALLPQVGFKPMWHSCFWIMLSPTEMFDYYSRYTKHLNLINSVYVGRDGLSSISMQKPQPFHHNVQWDIADIRMLLGSDLPIFGRDSHPAISLRLRCGMICTSMGGVVHIVQHEV